MKKIILALSLPILFSAHANTLIAVPQELKIDQRKTAPTKIQVALLLDTSSSMDGLINQAKSRLWNIVNTLSTLKFQGQDPILEIAIYEYGNNNIKAQHDYIRQVTGFTSDLDLISELLFSLTTYGGQEYCGTVIQRSLSELEWSTNNHSLKLMYIAGNETFNQGEVYYKNAIKTALNHKISLHTIYCGDHQAGIQELWKDAAHIAGGKYFNINTNKSIQYRSTPYDDKISQLNDELNQTYIGYGREGELLKHKQTLQDENAKEMDKTVMTERALTKSSSKYSNANWDVVDAYNQDKNFINNKTDEELPNELKNLMPKEREKKIIELNNKRKHIQQEVQKLAQEREKYLNSQPSEHSKDDLGYAITESILELAVQNNYSQ